MPSFSFLSMSSVPPGKSVSSSQWDLELHLPVGTVAARSGVQFRFISDPGVEQSLYASQAIRQACHIKNIPLESLDIVISCSAIGQQALPYHAAHILHHLDLHGKQAFDINSSCLSFLQSLQMAASLFSIGAASRIAIVGCDLPTRGIYKHDPEAGWIFGDGCAAVILDCAQKSTMLSYVAQTFPLGREYCEVRGGGTQRNPVVGMINDDFYFHMDGKKVFKLASQHMQSILDTSLHNANLKMSDIAWVVPHQASHLGMHHMRKRLGISNDQLVDIYSTHANQVAASMPTALCHLESQKCLRNGDHILFIGTAAGLTLSSSIVRWGE